MICRRKSVLIYPFQLQGYAPLKRWYRTSLQVVPETNRFQCVAF